MALFILSINCSVFPKSSKGRRIDRMSSDQVDSSVGDHERVSLLDGRCNWTRKGHESGKLVQLGSSREGQGEASGA